MHEGFCAFEAKFRPSLDMSRSDLQSEVYRVMNLYFEKETSRYIANQGVCRNSSEVLFPLHLPKGSGIEKNQYFHTLEYRYFRASISCFKPCF